MIKIEPNLRFSGSYYLLKWILAKYKKELPYGGEIKQFSLQNHYSINICDQWRNYGVGYRVWNIIHKDLLIAHLVGKIESLKDSSLHKLKGDYEAWKKS